MTRGFAVKAFDVYQPSLEKAKEHGITACSTPAAAAENVQVLGLMVVNAAQVDEVLFGANGAAAGEMGSGDSAANLSQHCQRGAPSSAFLQSPPAFR